MLWKLLPVATNTGAGYPCRMDTEQPLEISGATHMQYFRENLKRHRSMSQTALAERMNKRGHAFRQQTIQKIESGGRPVSLEEAVDLAAELGVTVEKLSTPTEVFDTLVLLSEKILALLGGLNDANRAKVLWWETLPEAQRIFEQLESMDAHQHLAGSDRESYLEMAADIREWSAAGSPGAAFLAALDHAKTGAGRSDASQA